MLDDYLGMHFLVSYTYALKILEHATVTVTVTVNLLKRAREMTED